VLNESNPTTRKKKQIKLTEDGVLACIKHMSELMNAS